MLTQNIGATPDGIVENNSILEIKCPATAEKSTVENAIINKKIKFGKLVNGEFQLNFNDNYMYQVQGQLQQTKNFVIL